MDCCQMLRLDRQNRTFVCVERRPLPDAGLQERSDLQRMIRNTPEEFFKELGEPLLLIGEENPSRTASDLDYFARVFL
jgi:hypothetical protein